MSEVHVEHPKSKRTKEALRRKGKYLDVLKAFFIDMIPVTLGILIALSLNGIKESYKESKEEEYYLDRLSFDLKEDLLELKDDVANYRVRQYGAQYLRTLIDSSTNMAANDSAFIYFSNLFGQTAPNITNATYVTLTSSGKLDIIGNKKIVESLVNLYTDVTVGLRNITGSFNDFKQRHINEVIYTQFDFASLNSTKNLQDVLANKQIKNALNLLWFEETIGRYEKAIAAHELLIKRINEELNH